MYIYICIINNVFYNKLINFVINIAFLRHEIDQLVIMPDIDSVKQ